MLRIDDQSAAAVIDALGALAMSTDLSDLSGCVAVYRNGELRVRRAPAS